MHVFLLIRVEKIMFYFDNIEKDFSDNAGMAIRAKGFGEVIACLLEPFKVR